MSKPLTTANRLSARLVSAGALALALIAVGHSAPALARQHDVAASIEADLARGDTARAIQTAENAVAAEPRDAQARAALGRTYIKAGRYASAVTALNDAVALGETGVKTLEDLADLATDELRGAFESKGGERVRNPGALENFNLAVEDAEAIILRARVAAGWIDAADIAPPESEEELVEADAEDFGDEAH